MPHLGVGHPRVTHPFATKALEQALKPPFDLHVLGTLPAFILSQDQTLQYVANLMALAAVGSYIMESTGSRAVPSFQGSRALELLARLSASTNTIDQSCACQPPSGAAFRGTRHEPARAAIVTSRTPHFRCEKRGTLEGAPFTL